PGVCPAISASKAATANWGVPMKMMRDMQNSLSTRWIEQLTYISIFILHKEAYRILASSNLEAHPYYDTSYQCLLHCRARVFGKSQFLDLCSRPRRSQRNNC